MEKTVKVEALVELRVANGKKVEAGGTAELPEGSAKILEQKKKVKILKEGK